MEFTKMKIGSLTSSSTYSKVISNQLDTSRKVKQKENSYVSNGEINQTIILKKINELHLQFSSDFLVIKSSSIEESLKYFFNTIYNTQKDQQHTNQRLSDNQLIAVKSLYDLLQELRQFNCTCAEDIFTGYVAVFGGWSRNLRYNYCENEKGQTLISGYKYIDNDINCTALTSYLKDVLAYEKLKLETQQSYCNNSRINHHSASKIQNLISITQEIHPKVNHRKSFKCVPKNNSSISISFFIRRCNSMPDSFLESMIYNTYRKDKAPEVRPSTAISVLKGPNGKPIVSNKGNSIAIGLLGDAFPFKKSGHLCDWSEQGEFVFDNTAEMVTAQKCDIWSGPIPLHTYNGVIDRHQFQFDMEKRAAVSQETHIEGKWLDKALLYEKMLNQANKALGFKPMGSYHKTGKGRCWGIPKNKYSNYVKLFNQFGVIPHNEAFMIHDLRVPFRIGINTHSKTAFKNSLKLYINTVRFLKQKRYYDLAKKLTLVIYNNQTGEVKHVNPEHLYQLYLLTPDCYTIDHQYIHPEERFT